MKPRNEPIFTKEPDRYLQELDREHEEFWNDRRRFEEDPLRESFASTRRAMGESVDHAFHEIKNLEASEKTISEALATVRRLGVEAFRLEERAKHQALSVKDLYDLEAALSDACAGLRVARELLEPEKPF